MGVDTYARRLQIEQAKQNAHNDVRNEVPCLDDRMMIEFEVGTGPHTKDQYEILGRTLVDEARLLSHLRKWYARMEES